jgi:hypothetical protein
VINTYLGPISQLLSFAAACFTVHPSYTFPLAVLGFIVTSHRLLPSGPNESNLLVIFSLLWLGSVFTDIVWLSRHSGQATDLVSFCVGANMCIKVVSAVACSTALLHLGVLDMPDGAGAGLPQSGRFSGGSALGSDTLGRSRTGLSFSSQSTLVDGRGAVSGAGRTAPPARSTGAYTDEDVEQNAARLDAGDEDARVVDSKVLFDHEASSEGDDQPPRQPSRPQGGYHTIE